MKNSVKKIALGMSGGVDSSVCAALLREQGYEVTGVFLECWRAPGCRVEEDRKDALNVALQLGIPFQVLDFKEEYRARVVEYFFTEYAVGRTPNPDVMCNKEIKFGMFYDWAMRNGFDAVATGHYARIDDGEEQTNGKCLGGHSPGSLLSLGESRPSRSFHLLRGVDDKKDQSYFLYLLRQEQLGNILFPIGHLQKVQVRELAKTYVLPVAKKPDSQGICFIGEINVHQFLRERLGEKPGEVVNTAGEVIGEHKGLWFYTIGQRHGFTLKGKIRSQSNEWKHVIPPFYVIGKDSEKNQLIVGFGEETLQRSFLIRDMHWIDPEFSLNEKDNNLLVRVRHGGKLYGCVTHRNSTNDLEYTIDIEEGIQGIAEGQSAVLYRGEECLGGGVIYA